jgi:hypothetical protein
MRSCSILVGSRSIYYWIFDATPLAGSCESHISFLNLDHKRREPMAAFYVGSSSESELSDDEHAELSPGELASMGEMEFCFVGDFPSSKVALARIEGERKVRYTYVYNSTSVSHTRTFYRCATHVTCGHVLRVTAHL